MFKSMCPLVIEQMKRSLKKKDFIFMYVDYFDKLESKPVVKNNPPRTLQEKLAGIEAILDEIRD
jgi:hypothetical protein